MSLYTSRIRANQAGFLINIKILLHQILNLRILTPQQRVTQRDGPLLHLRSLPEIGVIAFHVYINRQDKAHKESYSRSRNGYHNARTHIDNLHFLRFT